VTPPAEPPFLWDNNKVGNTIKELVTL
jgi:hypothetical protein